MKKGNMLIAQSGGPSMVINQSLIGAVEAALASDRIGGVFGALHGIQGILDERFIDFRKESAETLRKVAATPSSALGSVRRKPSPDDCRAIFAVLAKLEISYFFYIGGNDSAETAHIINEAAREAAYPLHCFHIPKTIDNDLLENDHTPGFGSAARFVACAVRGDDLDNRALGGVKIDVIMGRHAGFLTAAAALARQDPGDGPHLLYFPERPFSTDAFVADVADAMKRYGRCVIAVSEGIGDETGASIMARFSNETDSHGNIQLSGTGALGDLLAGLVKEKLGIKRVRADTFGYIQRCFVGCASETDSAEARQAGAAAVQAALSGLESGSIALRREPGDVYKINFEPVPLRAVSKNTRHLPDAFIAQSGHDVTEEFLAYARPLAGALPETARFKQLNN